MNTAPSADVRPRRSGYIGIDEEIHPIDVIARPNLANAALVPEPLQTTVRGGPTPAMHRCPAMGLDQHL